MIRTLASLALCCALAACLSGSREAALVMEDLAAGAADSPLKATTAPPQRRSVTYAGSGRTRQADLYLPDQVRAALVLVPGATPEGRNDAKLMAAAETLARAQFAVLVPELEAGPALRLSAADSEPVGDAVRHMGRDGRPVTLAAISYGAGPALLAALRPDTAARIGTIVLIGGYYDMTSALTFLTTGCAEEAGQWRCRPPNQALLWHFARSNAARLADPADRRIVRAVAERKLANPDAPSPDPGSVGPDGAAVLDLLLNRDPQRVPALIAALPIGLRNDLQALDLSRRDLSGLTVPVLLIHGADDPLIPQSESVRLAAALGGRARLFLPQRLAHVDASVAGLGDLNLLADAVDALLAARGG